MKKSSKHTRRLAVRAEILRELAQADLEDVEGGAEHEHDISECQRNSCLNVGSPQGA